MNARNLGKRKPRHLIHALQQGEENRGVRSLYTRKSLNISTIFVLTLQLIEKAKK